MSDRVFLDSNVLVYFFDSDTLDKQSSARALLDELSRDSILVVSTQVLQESYVSVTRKLKDRSRRRKRRRRPGAFPPTVSSRWTSR
jgi:predicted nucleic acid-binding protein